jgi:Putative peptidoglycan binding domain
MSLTKRSRIESSVGRGGKNRKGDVKYVQWLLSVWLSSLGRATLAIDGICGPLTQDAVDRFQRAATLAADGRLDPGGPTLAALEEMHWRPCRSGQERLRDRQLRPPLVARRAGGDR